MKKIINKIQIITLFLFLISCNKIDNWPSPDARIHGKIIDSYTGKELLTSQGDWAIRIWERSWTESEPINQTLPVKQDGSYNNNKLFSGVYDMLPYGGAFWPADTVKNLSFGKNTEQDFIVTPYLQLVDFEVSLDGVELSMKCRLNAPKLEGLPNLVEVKPFVSLNTFCGETNNINIAEYNDKRIQINKSWLDEVGDKETSDFYEIGPLELKSGYTYYVRLGANVNDANKKYNYSEIVKVEVPSK